MNIILSSDSKMITLKETKVHSFLAACEAVALLIYDCTIARW